MSDGITAILARYIAAAAGKALPAPVAEKTKQHILDTLAACVSGAHLAAGERAISYARSMGSKQEATVIASNVRVSAIDAALANGMMAHADETDDSHAPSLTHPGCAVVPAALAAGELFNTDGATFVRAVAAGYDVGCRLAAALGGPEFHKTHHSTHAIGGVFGAAAAAGVLAKFDAANSAVLLSYAAQQAAGVTSWRRDPDHIEKSFVFAGMPARNGMASVSMVAGGFTGVSDTLEGEQGFFAAFARDGDFKQATDRLGERHTIMETTIKRWCVGSPIQAALDSALALVTGATWTPQDVARVLIELPSDGARVVDNRPMPDINVQHMIGMMIVDGNVTFDSCHDMSRMADARILGLRAKTELVAVDELVHAEPPRQGKVTIWLKDGTRLHHHTRAVKGTPADPMTADEIADKARDLMAPVLGNTAAQVVETVYALDKQPDLSKLTALLRRD